MLFTHTIARLEKYSRTFRKYFEVARYKQIFVFLQHLEYEEVEWKWLTSQFSTLTEESSEIVGMCRKYDRHQLDEGPRLNAELSNQ